MNALPDERITPSLEAKRFFFRPSSSHSRGMNWPRKKYLLRADSESFVTSIVDANRYANVSPLSFLNVLPLRVHLSPALFPG